MPIMLLTTLCGFLPALNIVGEKEAGTIEQTNVTPVKRLMFVMAKLIPYWIIGFVVLSICMGLAALVYGIFPAGSLLTIFLFASIYILVVSGVGLVISNYSDTMQQAMFVMYFFMMILLLMSGLFTPVSSMPQWAEAIEECNKADKISSSTPASHTSVFSYPIYAETPHELILSPKRFILPISSKAHCINIHAWVFIQQINQFCFEGIMRRNGKQ